MCSLTSLLRLSEVLWDYINLLMLWSLETRRNLMPNNLGWHLVESGVVLEFECLSNDSSILVYLTEYVFFLTLTLGLSNVNVNM